ncbi:HD domain-containing protein [Feifania hominis]|uniref:HD domain-containing protein n=1 Tax=Feifania hominis TaxID=2763660 RepID=A0A926HR60_9FIRM|nr:HD domain-containing protein [Feifania hominis]MBC8537077.1 HD domain-containing protein [Feifania hominis]
MAISTLIARMISDAGGNRHDIEHFLKVYAYAKTIGECEELDRRTQEILEAAAVVHDIACPLCREKYGSTVGKYQEREGAPMAQALLRELGYDGDFAGRVAWLVGHHHTFQGVDGPDHQILLEADYLVNAGESSYSEGNIRHTLDAVFRTETGRALLRAIYLGASM